MRRSWRRWRDGERLRIGVEVYPRMILNRLLPMAYARFLVGLRPVLRPSPIFLAIAARDLAYSGATRG